MSINGLTYTSPVCESALCVCCYETRLYAYLVVLGHNHVGVLGEVEVEGRLVGAQVVHVEDEALIHT